MLTLNYLPVFEEILRDNVKKNLSKNTSEREKKGLKMEIRNWNDELKWIEWETVTNEKSN